MNQPTLYEFVEDREGVALADYAAARRKAVDSLRGGMAGDLLMDELNTTSFIRIEDEHRELIETVSFAAVVSLRDEAPAVHRLRWSHEWWGAEGPTAR